MKFIGLVRYTHQQHLWHPVKSLLLNGILQMKHNFLATVLYSFETELHIHS